ncbi:hypothetical protein BG004_002679 [Podila humilis]|nr:hypothetical protein BG004_002679 [Podila humilis]
MTNGKTMSGPLFSLLGSEATPSTKESVSDEMSGETFKRDLHAQSNVTTPATKTSKERPKVSGQSSQKSILSEVTLPKQTKSAESKSTASKTTTPTGKPAAATGSNSTSKSVAVNRRDKDEDSDLSDFDGSDLSEVGSISDGSDNDMLQDESDSDSDENSSNGSQKGSSDEQEPEEHSADKVGTSSDSSASDSIQPKRTKKPGRPISGSKVRVKNNRRIQSDSSSEDERVRPVTVKRKPGRPPKVKSNGHPVSQSSPVSPTISRNKSSTTHRPSEDTEMEDVVSPTSETQGRKKGKQPDFSNIGKRDRSGRTQLFRFTAMGDLETCRQLIEAGAQVNDRDYAEWTPLHEACVTGHDKVAELLIQHHARVNAQGGQLDTPLHDAAQNGHVDVVKLLLAHGANVMAKNKHGITPLDAADDKDVIDLLQKRQAQVTMLTGKNQAGQTVLHRSCSSGTYSHVVDLVNQGADINAQDNAQWTPLHEAALAGHIKVVEFLLSRGANPNAMGHGNDTALHDASQNEHGDVVRLLLEYGADPDLKNCKGEKPLDVCDDDEILDLLKGGVKATKKPVVPVASPSISSGSSLSSLSSHSSKTSTPAHTSPFLGHNKSWSKFSRRTKEGSADMSDDGRSAGEDRPTPGQMSRDERKMQQLLSTIRMQEEMEERRKAKKRIPKQPSDDEEMEDNSNKSNTQTATSTSNTCASRWKSTPTTSVGNTKKSAESGSTRIQPKTTRTDSRRRSSRSADRTGSDTETERGARGRRSVQRSLGDRFRIDHRYKDSAGRTQLHQWAEVGDLEMVGTLLEGGADRSPEDQDGATPLHLAAKAGHTEVLTLLLAYGCNVNAQDHDKTTALHEAVRHHHTEAVRMLLQNNARLGLRDSKKRVCFDLASSNDSEIKVLLKQAMDQAEKKSAEKSKKRVSQVMEAHNLPKTKERKTSRVSDSDEAERPAKSKSKANDKAADNKKPSSTILKSVSMPSISASASQSSCSITPSSSTAAKSSTSTATLALSGKSSWTRPERKDDGVITPLKKQKPHSRKTSSSMADDDVDMQTTGSSKKRRDIERPAELFGGKVKIKKEKEEDGPSFRSQGITAKAEELRRAASTSFLKEPSSHVHRPSSTPKSSVSSSSKSGAAENGRRPNSLPGSLSATALPLSSSVASISPPLTETSSSISPPPQHGPSTVVPSQVNGVQDMETNSIKSRKRNSQTFSSPSGYLKFADDLKLGSMTSSNQNQRFSSSLATSNRVHVPSEAATTSVTSSGASATGAPMEPGTSRKKAKMTVTEAVVSPEQTSTKPVTTEETLSTNKEPWPPYLTVTPGDVPGTPLVSVPSTPLVSVPSTPSKSATDTTAVSTTFTTADAAHVPKPEPIAAAAAAAAPPPPPEIKQEAIEVQPSMRSVHDAQRYLPLYTVQLSGDTVESESPIVQNSKYTLTNGTLQQHFCVVDRQVQLLLGLRPGSLFLRYPHLYRRMVTKREKARLWSPLSSMVSDRCAAAVKFNYEITLPLPQHNHHHSHHHYSQPLQQQQQQQHHHHHHQNHYHQQQQQQQPQQHELPQQAPSFISTTEAMSRLKEFEKQKFLGCDLYFIRLEEVIEVIKRDYGQLNESMMTITLDIGYDEAEMEVDDSDNEKEQIKKKMTEEDQETALKQSVVEAKAVEVKKEPSKEPELKPIKQEGEYLLKQPQSQQQQQQQQQQRPLSNVGGYIHKLRRVPAKMAAKAMFKEMQLQMQQQRSPPQT